MNDHLTDPAEKTTEPQRGNGSELKPLLGCRISECEDLEFLREKVEQLWQVLDEIDTTSDIAKDNDEFYRKRVEHWQGLRHNFGIVTDGYDLFRNIATKQWQHEDTGRTTESPVCPGKRWYEIKAT